jgi:F0F1-type ATP synthase assembly protein I
MSRGMEIAGTTAVFFFLGFGADRLFGTTPWLMVVFVLLALVGQFTRAYYVYSAAMDVHERRRLEAARPVRGEDGR